MPGGAWRPPWGNAAKGLSREYLEMWIRIVKKYPAVRFWTYTKIAQFETAFDCFDNANIVRSVITVNGKKGFNFGHCGYIMKAYEELKNKGESVHICKCGVDKNQYCSNCAGCSKNKNVLFIEHSTEYKAEIDVDFEALRKIIESQLEN